jgi:protease IV
MTRIIKLIFTIFMAVILIQIFPSVATNIKEEYSSFFENRAEMARLKIDGNINNVDEHINNLRKYFENKNIKAILLHIESPGGIPGPAQALFKEIKSLKREHPTPVVALTTSLCTFSAYYVASVADYIVASPSALVGGIATYTDFFKSQSFVNNWTMQDSQNKIVTLGTTEETNKIAENLSTNIYKQFTKDIAIARKLSLKDTDKWANGTIFTGDQALSLKLVDELGSEFNAVKKMRELALIEKEQKIKWVLPKSRSPLSRLLSCCKL